MHNMTIERILEAQKWQREHCSYCRFYSEVDYSCMRHCCVYEEEGEEDARKDSVFKLQVR